MYPFPIISWPDLDASLGELLWLHGQGPPVVSLFCLIMVCFDLIFISWFVCVRVSVYVCVRLIFF